MQVGKVGLPARKGLLVFDNVYYMHIKKILTGVLLVVVLTTGTLRAQRVEATWESINQRGYPEWFGDAKLGIFVHWGLYSVPAFAHETGYAEWFYRGLMEGDTGRVATLNNYIRLWEPLLGDQWSGRMTNVEGMTVQTPKLTDRYALFVPLWRAEHWNPDQWAELFARSGAKYVLLVTKHHDGYCLWNSRYQPNWNSVTTGPRRDIVGELTQAVRRAGMKMGFYYSLTEWTNPRHVWYVDPDGEIDDYVENYMIPQFKELVGKYQPSVIFTDGEWRNTAEQFHARELISWYYNTVGAEAIVNDRWGEGTQHGFKTPEYKGAIADTTRPWAECRGMGRSFGLNRNEPLSNYLTSDSLIRHLVKLVAAGGGLTLNVGPEADGTIPLIQQERLLDLGKWMDMNGEAIYGTKPYKRICERDSSVYYTRKGSTVYAFCMEIPEESVVLKAVDKPVKGTKVTLLGTGKELKWRWFGGKMYVSMKGVTLRELAKMRGAWVIKIES